MHFSMNMPELSSASPVEVEEAEAIAREQAAALSAQWDQVGNCSGLDQIASN